MKTLCQKKISEYEENSDEEILKKTQTEKNFDEKDSIKKILMKKI